MIDVVATQISAIKNKVKTSLVKCVCCEGRCLTYKYINLSANALLLGLPLSFADDDYTRKACGQLLQIISYVLGMFKL